MGNVFFRADDAGSTEGANRAIVECVRNGVVRNVSVMVPGPAFMHAVPLLKDIANINLGLHVTLSAEWDTPKWAPILPPHEVPSLVERDGVFTQNPGVLQSRGFSVDEAMAEVAAQLAMARSAGLHIDYLDEHMGVGWIDGLGPRLMKFAEDEGLALGRYPYFGGPTGSILDEIVNALSQLEEPAIFVTHPGLDDDPIMASFIHKGQQPGQIHKERIRDRRLLTHPKLRQAVESGRIRSLTYREQATFRPS